MENYRYTTVSGRAGSNQRGTVLSQNKKEEYNKWLGKGDSETQEWPRGPEAEIFFISLRIRLRLKNV